MNTQLAKHFCLLAFALTLSQLVSFGGCVVGEISNNDIGEGASKFDQGDAIVYAWHEGSAVRASLFLAGDDTQSDREASLLWQDDGQLSFDFSDGDRGYTEMDDLESNANLSIAAELLYEAWRSPQERINPNAGTGKTTSQATVTGVVRWRNRRVGQCAQLTSNNNIVLRNCNNGNRQQWREHRVRVRLSPTRVITIFRFESVARGGLCLTRGAGNILGRACPALPGPGQNFNLAHPGYFFRIPHAGGWLITRATRYVSLASLAPDRNVLVRIHPNPASSIGVDHWDRQLVQSPQSACPSPEPRMRLRPEFSVGMEEQFALQHGEVLTIPFNSGAAGRIRRLAFGEPGPGGGAHFAKTVILSRCPGVYDPQSYHGSSVDRCVITGLEMAFSIVSGPNRAAYPLSQYRCVLEPNQPFYINVLQRFAGPRPPYTANMTNTCQPSASGRCGVRVSAR